MKVKCVLIDCAPMHVQLLVPDLLVPRLLPSGTDPGPGIRLKALEILLAKGRRMEGAAPVSAELWLKTRFGIESAGDAGAAAWSLLGDKITPGDSTWLRADPVHLSVDRDTLMLGDSTLFNVSEAEAEALSAHLNAHFSPDLVFLPAHPRRWYVRTEKAASLLCTPLAQARGRTISAHLPGGVDAVPWHALMNEIQMALHDHPVNEARETRGELPVNSIWFWGSGAFQPVSSRPFDHVLSDDPLARGLALASGSTAAPLAPDATSLLSAASDGGQVLVVLDALRAPAAYGDLPAWEAQTEAMELSLIHI